MIKLYIDFEWSWLPRLDMFNVEWILENQYD